MKLEIRHIYKRYGSKPALFDIDIVLEEGVYGLLGPNGAGKSTLMNIIVGNLSQNAGEVLWNGNDIRDLGRRYRSRLGYMPQQQAFYPIFTAEQFLYYIAALRGMEKGLSTERICWALKLLSLWDVRKNKIGTFSEGMRQRLLLAQAILADPDILVLDEPTAGLDPKQRIAVRNLVAELALHKIVLISTHVVPDVEYVAKEVILLSDGHVLRKSTASALTRELYGKVWEAHILPDQLPETEKIGKLCSITRGHKDILVRILSDARPSVAFTPTQPTLEDVYLYHFDDTEGRGHAI